MTIDFLRLTPVNDAGLDLSICGQVSVANEGATLTLKAFKADDSFNFSIPNDLVNSTFPSGLFSTWQFIDQGSVFGFYPIFKRGNLIYCVCSTPSNVVSVRTYGLDGTLRSTFTFDPFAGSIVRNANTLFSNYLSIEFVNTKGNIGILYFNGYVGGNTNAILIQKFMIQGDIDLSNNPPYFTMGSSGSPFSSLAVYNSEGVSLNVYVRNYNTFANEVAFSLSRDYSAFRQSNNTYVGDPLPYYSYTNLTPAQSYYTSGTIDYTAKLSVIEYVKRPIRKLNSSAFWISTINDVPFQSESGAVDVLSMGGEYIYRGLPVTLPAAFQPCRLLSLDGHTGFVVLSNEGKFFYYSTGESNALAASRAVNYKCANYIRLFDKVV